MNALSIDIKRAGAVDPADRNSMPVSAIATEDGGRHVISRYGDSKWDFYPFIPQLC